MPLSLIDQSGNVHLSHDADYLYRECVEHQTETDWWYPLANRVTLKAGCDPSEAYLLLTKTSLNAISQSHYNHQIGFDDALDSFNVQGWVYDSAQAITPSELPADSNTIYLVKFCDKRLIFAKSKPNQLAYNLVSEFVLEPATYNPADPASFPYNTQTLFSGGVPWTWENLLLDLWNTFPSGGSFPPLTGSYPAQLPLDIRTQDDNSLGVFCRLLHAIGFDLYPTLAGGFAIQAIDTHYGVASLLSPFAAWLIDDQYPSQGIAVDFPATFRFAFQSRNRNLTHKHKNPYHFVLIDVAGLGLGVTVVAGAVETITTPALTAVFKQATTTGNPENQSDLVAFATAITTRIVKQRITTSLDATFCRYVAVSPGSEFGEVEFSIGNDRGIPNEISTTFRSYEIEHSSSLPEIDAVGSSLREFELTAVKTSGPSGQTMATVKWLDLAGSLVGGDATIYDPDRRFSGRPANYIPSERGFRGLAEEREDLSNPGTKRWEIIAMESFAEWCVVEVYSSNPLLWVLSIGGFGGGQWDWRQPVVIDGLIGVFDPAHLLTYTPEVGERAIARIAFPDSTPPVYALHGVRGGASDINAPRGVVYSVVHKAIGALGQARTPGTGLVQFYVPPSPTSPIGTPWQPGPSIIVENWMGSDSVVGKPVHMRPSRILLDGSTIYELSAEGCAGLTSPG